MPKFTVSLNINMENGDNRIIKREVEADDPEKAVEIIYRAWIDYLYVETDAYKVVKNSGITIDAPKELTHENR